MENQQEENKSNYLRWCVSIVLLVILFIDLFLYKNQPSTFHFIILGILLIFGIADRFKVIKIPGVIELKDKTESVNKKTETIDKKLDQLTNQLQNLQTQFKPQTSETNQENK
jgi:hypothetical protein